MVQLGFDDRERRALSETLQSFLSERRTEASHTDRQAYRQRPKIRGT
jgi:hypothetical protein